MDQESGCHSNFKLNQPGLKTWVCSVSLRQWWLLTWEDFVIMRRVIDVSSQEGGPVSLVS